MTTVRETYEPASSTSVVGTSVPRLDDRAKVTGRARYAEDHIPRGALHAAVQRSQRPHARLVSVDTRAALGVEGVIAVLTGADLYTRLGERIRSGPAFADQPILALERVRYVGEPIAVVVAETRATALQAVELIEAGYEELPAVHDARAALESGSALVHDVLRPSHVFKDLA